MNNYFPSTYPIVLAPMNGCSTVKLAAAAHEAGIFPCLVPLTKGAYDKQTLPGFLDSEADLWGLLQEYYKLTGSKNLLLQVSSGIWHYPDVVKILIDWQPSHLYIMKPDPFYTSDEEQNLDFINSDDIKDDVYKVLQHTKFITSIKLNACQKIASYDAYTVLGNSKAGQCGNLNLEEFVVQQKNLEPDFPIIASGGIYSSAQIKNLLTLGASAVAIGTMFTTAQESDLSVQAKNKIINSSFADSGKFGPNQNVLQNEIADSYDPTNPNGTDKIYQGTFGDSSSGHIPIGPAVDFMQEIKPLRDIVALLVEDL